MSGLDPNVINLSQIEADKPKKKKKIKVVMDIIQYIEQYRTKKGEPYTHTGMSNPMGCFNIPDDKMKEFISTCHDNIIKLKKKISITEKHLKTHSPALYDIDLRYPLKENKDEKHKDREHKKKMNRQRKRKGQNNNISE